MSEIELFSYADSDLRVLQIDGAPWFVAADVARILGYRDAFNMARRLDPEDRGTRLMSTPSGEQEMTIISEPGLYAAVLGSQVEGARTFKRWITHDVIPAIRRTGSYAVAPARALPASYADALRALAAEVEKREAVTAERDAAREHAAVLAPKADAWDAVCDADGSASITATAKAMQSARINVGVKEFALFAHKAGLIYRAGGVGDWTPYDDAMRRGWMTTRLVNGGGKSRVQARFLPPGIAKIRELLIADRGTKDAPAAQTRLQLVAGE